jgi:hypothetical protein
VLKRLRFNKLFNFAPLFSERLKRPISWVTEGIMFEVSDILPNSQDGELLSPEQAAIGLNLRRYCQLNYVARRLSDYGCS